MSDASTPLPPDAFDPSAAQLQLAASLAGIGLWRENIGAPALVANAQVWAMLGRPFQAAGITMAEVLEALHPDDAAELTAERQRLLAGQPVGDRILRMRHPDGRWRRLLVRRVLLRDLAGRPRTVAGVVMDVSERMEHAEHELEIGRHLELAADAAGLAIWTWSPGNDDAHWNDRMLQLHGLPATAAVPDFRGYFDRFVHPDDREAARDGMRLLMSRGRGMTDLDLRVMPADGAPLRRLASRTTAQTRNGSLQLHGIMMDVTGQHEVQEQLRRADERAALVARGAGIGTWDLDETTGETWWNEQMWLLRGLEPAATPPGADARVALVHPADREALELEYRQAEAERRSSHAEFRIRLPDGRWRWLASRASALHDATGRITRRIGINWDITDIRNAEAARQDRLLALRESQAKSRFLARMSHELRTPLNAVLGFTQLMLDDAASGDVDRRRERLGHVQQAGQHLLSLINDVLNLSSLESGDLLLETVPVALQPLVASALPLVADDAARKGIAVTTGELGLCVRADPRRLKQALLNLLSNAIKYNQHGGTVRVEAVARGAMVALCVSDTGRGMTRQQQAGLFEPFNRLGAEHSGIEGTGIGLAIVKATVERMGGSVAVSSEAGQGSRFELRLPTTDEPAAPVDTPLAATPGAVAADTGAPAIKAAQAAPSHRVLYIEDNAVNVLIVRELLARRTDIAFESAESGLDGIARARDWQPDLVLLDMQLPDIGGDEVLRRLRADPATAGICCMALSANAVPEDVERALASGFAAYWTKPLDFDAFMHALGRQLASRR
ncbi:MAG: PAS domain-containing protein [Aquabacterium sp.]